MARKKAPNQGFNGSQLGDASANTKRIPDGYIAFDKDADARCNKRQQRMSVEIDLC